MLYLIVVHYTLSSFLFSWPIFMWPHWNLVQTWHFPSAQWDFLISCTWLAGWWLDMCHSRHMSRDAAQDEFLALQWLTVTDSDNGIFVSRVIIFCHLPAQTSSDTCTFCAIIVNLVGRGLIRAWSKLFTPWSLSVMVRRALLWIRGHQCFCWLLCLETSYIAQWIGRDL